MSDEIEVLRAVVQVLTVLVICGTVLTMIRMIHLVAVTWIQAKYGPGLLFSARRFAREEEKQKESDTRDQDSQ